MERTESTEKELTTPSTEVQEKPERRRFSAEYKLRILAEADGCTEMGRVGELLRREGLYASLLSTWRRQRDEGVLAGLKPIAKISDMWCIVTQIGNTVEIEVHSYQVLKLRTLLPEDSVEDGLALASPSVEQIRIAANRVRLFDQGVD